MSSTPIGEIAAPIGNSARANVLTALNGGYADLGGAPRRWSGPVSPNLPEIVERIALRRNSELNRREISSLGCCARRVP
jgi:hypothetical protein